MRSCQVGHRTPVNLCIHTMLLETSKDHLHSSLSIPGSLWAKPSTCFVWSAIKAEESKVYMTLLHAGFCNRAMWTLSNALLFSSLFLTELCHIHSHNVCNMRVFGFNLDLYMA